MSPTGNVGTLRTISRCVPAELPHLIAAFLLSRRAGNCSVRTLALYDRNLRRFATVVGAKLSSCTSVEMQQYLTGLGARMKPVSVHQHFRTLRTFFSWCVHVGLLSETPMRGLKMSIPKTLPSVPEDEAVRGLLRACSDTFEGRRNKAMVALLADSGLRISEALQLRIADVNFITFTLAVRGGKGGKDGTGYFGPEAAQVIRVWMKMRREAKPEDYLFTDRQGRPLSRSHGTHILHRLSARAGLDRKVGPHALRHYAATRSGSPIQPPGLRCGGSARGQEPAL
jgi:integrase/recombinase XerD